MSTWEQFLDEKNQCAMLAKRMKWTAQEHFLPGARHQESTRLKCGHLEFRHQKSMHLKLICQEPIHPEPSRFESAHFEIDSDSTTECSGTNRAILQRHWHGAHLLQLILLLVLAPVWLTGCQSRQALVQRFDLHETLQQGTTFRHRVVLNRAGQAALQQPAPVRWHIYIEGDGQAVTAQGRPSRDPTPRAPMLLKMLAQDPNPALYLGRPCYFDTIDPACNPARWTLERYSDATVASMAQTLLARIRPQDDLILIGHSGGGALAVLLAPRLPRTCAVITLAGNLDVTAWTRAHGYTPITPSLDPAQQPPLPARIHQWHLAGGQDREIKPEWIQNFAGRQASADYHEIADADHTRVWPDWFPPWLERLDIPPCPPP